MKLLNQLSNISNNRNQQNSKPRPLPFLLHRNMILGFFFFRSKSAIASNNVRVKSSSNANSNFGYVYQQFYYSNQCNGTIFAAIGISTTACLPLKNSSFSLSFSQGKSNIPFSLLFITTNMITLPDA